MSKAHLRRSRNATNSVWVSWCGLTFASWIEAPRIEQATCLNCLRLFASSEAEAAKRSGEYSHRATARLESLRRKKRKAREA